MKRLIWSCVFALSTTPALALSCVQPTVENAFTVAHEAPESYVPVLGSFSGILPRSEKGTAMPEDRYYTVSFDGIALTQRGVDIPVNLNVNVHEQCLASWCPSVPNNMQVLTFLRLENKTYSVSFNSCSPNAFFAPSNVQIDTMRSCLANGAC